MEIQKLRYADPRNRTKIEKFSQKGSVFCLAETLMSQIHTAPASLSPPPPVAELTTMGGNWVPTDIDQTIFALLRADGITLVVLFGILLIAAWVCKRLVTRLNEHDEPKFERLEEGMRANGFALDRGWIWIEEGTIRIEDEIGTTLSPKLMNLSASSPGDKDERIPMSVATSIGRSWEPVGSRPTFAKVINSESAAPCPEAQPFKTPQPMRAMRNGRRARAGLGDQEDAQSRSPLRIDNDTRPDEQRYIEEQRARLEAALLVHAKSPPSASPSPSASPVTEAASCIEQQHTLPVTLPALMEPQAGLTYSKDQLQFTRSESRIKETCPSSDDRWCSADSSQDVGSEAAGCSSSVSTPKQEPKKKPKKHAAGAKVNPPQPDISPLTSPDQRLSTAEEAMAVLTLLHRMNPDDAMQTIELIDENALLALQNEARKALEVENEPRSASKPTPNKGKGNSKPQPPKAKSPSPTKMPSSADMPSRTKASTPRARTPRAQSPRSPSPKAPSPRTPNPRPQSPRSMAEPRPPAVSPRNRKTRAASPRSGKKSKV